MSRVSLLPIQMGSRASDRGWFRGKNQGHHTNSKQKCNKKQKKQVRGAPFSLSGGTIFTLRGHHFNTTNKGARAENGYGNPFYENLA